MYCIKLKRSQDEFWHSSMAQIYEMIDIHADELKIQVAKMNNENYDSKYFKEKPEVVSSLKDIKGLV